MIRYDEALAVQHLLEASLRHDPRGWLLLAEHHPVITTGRDGGAEHLLVSKGELSRRGIGFVEADRGGSITYHGPGQLLVYPIVHLGELRVKDVRAFVTGLEEVVIRLAADYGIQATRNPLGRGVWIGQEKLASVALRVRHWRTTHGLALNVKADVEHFRLINPCGLRGCGVGSLAGHASRPVAMPDVKNALVRHFAAVFGYDEIQECPALAPTSDRGLPAVSLQPETVSRARRTARVLEDLEVLTICQEAVCPNIWDCFSRGKATFLILGNRCTRGCRFCAVRTGRPGPPDPEEPERIARAAVVMELVSVVITSVTRDDLPDGGASQYAKCVEAIRRAFDPAAGHGPPAIECLVPDFGGAAKPLAAVAAARPEVLGHNVETVPRLYPNVRPGADYARSLQVLEAASDMAAGTGMAVKSGLMLGLGEHYTEVMQVLADLRKAGCTTVTLGQYLAPSPAHYPVARVVSAAEFEAYRFAAEAFGFAEVRSGALVRSSYA